MAAASPLSSNRNTNHPHPRVIDSGGYGQIIYPALPNRDEEGRPVPLPGHLTKVFFRKSNYASMRNRENIIRSVVGPTAAMNAYQYSYHGQNLSPELQASLGIRRPDKRLYMLHQPFMGHSIGYLCTAEGYKRFSAAIAACSPAVLFGSVTELLRQTASMAEHGYVHGDIRPSNVLFDPATCRFTLIDFDLFDTYDNFYEEFMKGHGDYFSIPEALLVPEFESGVFNAYTNEEVSVDPLQFEQHCDSMYHNYKHYLNTHDIMSVDDYVPLAAAALQANTASLRRAVREGRSFAVEIVKEIDNHALALTLLEFFSCYSLPATDSVMDLMLLLQEMADLERDKRPSPQDAYDAIQAMEPWHGGKRMQRHTMRKTRRARRKGRRASFRRKH